ncbi:bifunctional inhibitor/plant lipid transfer protein/seed [Salix suchowensis]|nr:bifunctional inhibitor/plant lipid transfer protein/seed [Salix suchowensis]
MERLIKTMTLTCFAAFLLLLLLSLTPSTDANHLLLPHCVGQFSLANYACAMLPYTPFSPPSPPSPAPSPPSPESSSSSSSSSSTQHHESMAENCCKWLEALDTTCVCGLLHRLPMFLSKPAHEYTLHVSASCNVTYACNG